MPATRSSRFGNSETLSDEARLAYTTALAKLLQRLKKDAGAKTIAQNYRGTGARAYRRQLWVHFTSGAVIDLWLEASGLKFGGVVKNGVGGAPLPAGVAYDGRSPAEVYAEAARLLRDWATSSTGSFSRATRRRR